MITQNSAEPQASPLPTGAEAPVATVSPRAPIEVASTGDGTVYDPAGHDKPPGVGDSDPLFQLLG